MNSIIDVELAAKFSTEDVSRVGSAWATGPETTKNPMTMAATDTLRWRMFCMMRYLVGVGAEFRTTVLIFGSRNHAGLLSLGVENVDEISTTHANRRCGVACHSIACGDDRKLAPFSVVHVKKSSSLHDRGNGVVRLCLAECKSSKKQKSGASGRKLGDRTHGEVITSK